jgi:hypothetical protein
MATGVVWGFLKLERVPAGHECFFYRALLIFSDA